MMNSMRDYIAEIRAIRPELPDRLTSEEEERIIDTLRPYWDRISEARAAWGRGEIKGEGKERARGAAFRHVEMSPDEADAAFDLYVMTVALVATYANKVWRTSPYAIGFESVMQYSYESYLRTLSAYKPDGPARLTTWLGVDFCSELRVRLYPHFNAGGEIFIEDEPGLAGSTYDDDLVLSDEAVANFTSYVDLDSWAVDYTSDSADLRTVYSTLSSSVT